MQSIWVHYLLYWNIGQYSMSKEGVFPLSLLSTHTLFTKVPSLCFSVRTIPSKNIILSSTMNKPPFSQKTDITWGLNMVDRLSLAGAGSVTQIAPPPSPIRSIFESSGNRVKAPIFYSHPSNQLPFLQKSLRSRNPSASGFVVSEFIRTFAPEVYLVR